MVVLVIVMVIVKVKVIVSLDNLSNIAIGKNGSLEKPTSVVSRK